MNKYIRAGLLLWIPSKLLKYIFGGGSCGFSLILVDDFQMAKSASIGHFNIIRSKSLKLQDYARIGHLNIAKGHFDWIMESRSTILNCNRFTSLCKSQTYSTPRLLMHDRAKIVSRHFFDLTSSVEIGDRSTFAGAYSQCWTHGFLYGNKKRARLDGDIVIGNDCYIGASCILLGGIKIGDNITLGAGTTCLKSIDKSGLYVSSSLRYIPFDADERINTLGNPIAVLGDMECFKK